MAQRSWFQFWISLGVLMVLGFSTVGYSETYNFYFPPKGKKGQKVKKVQPPVEDEDTSDEEEADEEEADADAEKAERTSKSQEVDSKTTNVKQTTKVIEGEAAKQIIINNNFPAQPNAVGPQPAPAPQEPVASTTAVAPISLKKTGIVTLGLSTLFMGKNWVTPNSSSTIYHWGGLASFGIDVSKNLTLRGTGGLYHADPYDDGELVAILDAEIYPFAKNREGIDPIQLGFIVGGSTEQASHDNIGTIHAGARFTINLNDNFGLTSVARANLGMHMLEAGLLFRL